MTWKSPESDTVVSKTWIPPSTDEVISRDPSMMDYIRGINRGIESGMTTILGAPTDITSAILRKVGIVSEEAAPPFGGAESLKAGFEAIGMKPAPPTVETTGTRIAERVGEELGAAVFPVAGMYGAALKTGKAAVVGGGSLMRRMFLDPIAKAPGAMVSQDVASTIASGVGGGVAREAIPGSKTAETVGQVAGGAAPLVMGYGPVGLSIKAGKYLYSRFNTKAQLESGRKAVEKIMGSSLDREALENLASAQSLTERTGGQFQPSIAESTGVPSLIATQKQIEKEASGDFLNWVLNRKKNNITAIDNFTQSAAPKGDVSPEMVIDSATNELTIQGKRLEDTIARVVQTRKDTAASIATIDKMGTGVALREALFKARSAASLKMSEVADNLNVAGIDMTDAFNEWKVGVQKNYKPLSRFEDPSARPDVLNKIISDKADTTSFLDIKALRERVSDDLIDELSSAAPSRRKVRSLTLLKKDVDALFESAGGEAAENLAAFRKQYFEEYVKPFETGAMFKARNKDGTGFFRTRDEQVASLFLDNPSAAKQFRTVFGNDAAAMNTLEDAFLDKMRMTVAPDGMVDEKRLRSFVNKNKDVLNELPSLGKRVTDIETTQKMLITRQTELMAVKNTIEKDALAKHLLRYGRGDVTADVILNSSVNDVRKMRSLKAYLRNDPESLATLKRTIWDRTSKGSSSDVLKYMAANEASLKELFTPAHFNDLQDIAAMRTMMEVMPSQAGVAHIPTPLEHIEKAVGMGIPQASTRWYALMTGRLAKSYLMADISKSILLSKGRANIEALLRTALYDPAIAREMASAVRTGTLTESVGRRLSSRVFTLGLPYLRQEEEK